jgi:hypothetical protein
MAQPRAAPDFACVTTWRDTWAAIHQALGTQDTHSSASSFPSSCADEDAVAAVAPWTPWAPDAILNTARHLFFQARCGIFVMVGPKGVEAFVPFANAQYENWWWPRVRLLGPGGEALPTVEAYAAAKGKALGEPPERMLPLARWWLNGGIACNVLPADGSVWGTSFCQDLWDMLQEAARGAAAAGSPLPRACLFLNKRDFPVLRADGRDPYVRFVGDPAPDHWVLERYAAHAPVFSFYVGPLHLDVAMPTTEDWRAAKEEQGHARAWSTLRAAHPLATRAPVAVFRGSATSPARVALVQAAQGSALVDAAITGWNAYRDRVTLHHGGDGDPEPQVHVTFQAEYARRPRAPFMPLSVQAARFRYIVYCDGHCAAGRYGTLMHTGCVILRVPSAQAGDCGHLWALHGAVGVDVDDPPAAWLVADHVVLRSTQGADLVECVARLNAMPLDLLQAVADNAAARAPTVASVASFWQGWVRNLACARRVAMPAGAPTDKAWWSHADPKYAALPLRSSKK